MERFPGTNVTTIAEQAIAGARQAYGADWRPDRLAVAPGRIELLGNHVDYNGGPVLAAAIDRFIVVAAAPDTGRAPIMRAVASDLPEAGVVALDASTLAGWRNPSPPPDWADYARGLLAAMQEPARSAIWQETRLPLSLSIAGDVPIGFGVSSSAALCVALALATAESLPDPRDTVLLAQEAEHRAGTPCGTMDQSASIAGGVIAFDGATLGVERLSPELGVHVFVVADSGVERSLSTSSYPTRVAESREALDLARRLFREEIPHLAALTEDQVETVAAQGALSQPLLNRARHVVQETARVKVGQDAMAAGDWEQFGRLMTASGRSSAELYEISHPDVEALVAAALDAEGVLGARMMGGGEGGTALILLPRAHVPQLTAHLLDTFYRPRGMADRQGLLHVCGFSPGAAVLPGSVITAAG